MEIADQIRVALGTREMTPPDSINSATIKKGSATNAREKLIANGCACRESLEYDELASAQVKEDMKAQKGPAEIIGVTEGSLENELTR